MNGCQAARSGGKIVFKGLYSGLAGNLAGVLPSVTSRTLTFGPVVFLYSAECFMNANFPELGLSRTIVISKVLFPSVVNRAMMTKMLYLVFENFICMAFLNSHLMRTLPQLLCCNVFLLQGISNFCGCL